MKRVLIFVISCWEYPYPQLTQASIDTWDSVPVEGMETFFYCGLPKQSAPKQVIQFDVPEGLENMGKKNLLAFKWALDHGPWDYMARVNSSCYVRKKMLMERCQSLPEKRLFQGVGVVNFEGKVDFLWGGTQYIISRDVVQSIVDHGHKLIPKVMDDVALSNLVRESGIEFDLNGSACSINQVLTGWLIVTYGETKRIETSFQNLRDIAPESLKQFIRVKQDMKRELDIEIMKILYAKGIV